VSTRAAAEAGSTSELLAQLEGPDVERHIGAAFIEAGRRGDVPLFLAVVKGLVRVGLAGLAVRLLRVAAGTAHPSLAGQFTALAQQLDRLPSGEIPRQTLDARLARRRAEIPGLGSIEPDVLAYRSTRGNVQCFAIDETGRLRPLLPFIDHAEAAERLDLPAPTPTSSTTIVGLPSHAALARLLASTHPSGYTPAIDVLEPDANLAALWIAAAPDDCRVDDPRVSWFVGEGALDRYRTFLSEHPWRMPPTHTLTFRRGDAPLPAPDAAFREDVARRRAERDAEHVRIVAERVRDRDPAWYRRRFAEALAGGRPLHVGGFTSRFSTVIQHVVRDLGEAFERRGMRFDVVRQACDAAPAVDVRRALAENDFDAIVVVNHARCEFGDMIPAAMPFVLWIQDHMDQLASRDVGRSIGAADLVLCHAPRVLAALHEFPIERCVATSNRTSRTTFDAARLPEKERAQHRCDVSFAAHGSEPPRRLVEEIAHEIGGLKNLLDAACGIIEERLRHAPWITAQELVGVMLEAEATTGGAPLSPELRRARLYPQIVRIYDRVFRHQVVSWAAAWAASRRRSFRLYGRGWESHPRFAPFAAGTVEGGRSLRALFQASSIVLQANGHSSLHQRLLDALASGACVLSRENPADFLLAPFRAVRAGIERNRCATLGDLDRAREIDAELAAALEQAERLVGASFRPIGDPRRARFLREVREGNPVPELLDDDGLFAELRDQRLLPTRTAADLPGFAATTFRDEASLAALLDRLVDAPSERDALAEPMRAAVLEHDTYDVVVERILRAFSQEEPSCASSS
jgi:hypothetical protein